MKFGKGDIAFLVVYIIILFLLLLMTPVTIVGGSSSGIEESEILWNNIFWILLYAFAVPIIYFLIRWNYQKKK
jgi:hypothetical protein